MHKPISFFTITGKICGANNNKMCHMLSGSTKHMPLYNFMHVLCPTFLFEPYY